MMTIRPARISRGAIIAGQFRLERLLGQGGMGVVWAARELQNGRPVAVKLLSSEAMAKPELRQRFSREARITSRIRSPHVAHILAEGVIAGGVPFVAMELLEGESLAAHLAYVGRCSLITAGAVVEQVCRALSSAHVAGLVHRDVKPANIFLTQHANGELFVRLLDFGLAKELLFGASGLRQTGEVLGTADYMSPEQICSPESVSSAADIWSLGVVLYEMLTGKRPFDEKTFPLLALRIAEGSFLPPSRVCPDLPTTVDAVLARALATDPQLRYATAAEFGSEFLRIVRRHCSDSVVRPGVLSVLEGYDERSHANHPGQDRVALDPYEERSHPNHPVRGRVTLDPYGEHSHPNHSVQDLAKLDPYDERSHPNHPVRGRVTLDPYDERLQPNYPEHDRVTLEPVELDESTVRERLMSVLLVGLCLAVVFTSWLAATTFDDEGSKTKRSAARPAAETSPSAAVDPQLSAAQAAMLPAAAEAAMLPLTAAYPASDTMRQPDVPASIARYSPVPTPAPAPLALPDTPPHDARSATQAPAPLALPDTLPHDARSAKQAPAPLALPDTPPHDARNAKQAAPNAHKPTPAAPLKPTKPQRVDKPARAQSSAPERRVFTPPPIASPALDREAKYGF